MTFTLHQGDCIEVIRGMAENSVDSIVTDPPYELGFMGKSWDSTGIANSVALWTEALRVLKPGGHMLAFSGSRTYHRMVCAIEDAGFEVRDQIMWIYGSGFPKSHDVSKAIDKEADTKRPDALFGGHRGMQHIGGEDGGTGNYESVKNQIGRGVNCGALSRGTPVTHAAKQWEGWGTALKPAFEPLVVAVKPLLTSTEQNIIAVNLLTLEARLWSLLLANAAQKSSTSNQNELNAACAIAQWTVGDCTSTRGALCDRMDTSQFELATNTSLSIVSSWRSILGEVSKRGSTSITETKSSTTTCWTTLSYCLSQITPDTIITGQLRQPDNNAPASNAERYFSAELKRLNATQELSAVELAISQDRQNSLDVDASVKHEPICIARKPVIRTVATNVQAHGTGALNINGCRIDGGARPGREVAPMRKDVTYAGNALAGRVDGTLQTSVAVEDTTLGRWPANVIHDGSDEVVALFPFSTSGTGAIKRASASDTGGNGGAALGRESRPAGTPMICHGDKGSAARFFYCSKASKADRNEGCEHIAEKQYGHDGRETSIDNAYQRNSSNSSNSHPTVKPTDLMAYLCRLVTPPGGIILDPFMGSGSTGKAAVLEGFNFIGIDLSAEYLAIAKARIEHAERQGHQPSLELAA